MVLIIVYLEKITKYFEDLQNLACFFNDSSIKI